jgi:hypothetical protein
MELVASRTVVQTIDPEPSDFEHGNQLTIRAISTVISPYQLGHKAASLNKANPINAPLHTH